MKNQLRKLISMRTETPPAGPADPRLRIQLGVGTIWMGRRWPLDNAGYHSPQDSEVSGFLEQAYRSGIRMFDTAAAYGASEERVGCFFLSHPSWAVNTFISTKWGEYFNPVDEHTWVDHSVEQLRNSVRTSAERLPKIDLLYIHQANIGVLSDRGVELEMRRLADQNAISFLGASISDTGILGEALAQNRLWPQFLQVSARTVWDRPDLIRKAADHGHCVIVNSPVRKRPAGLSDRECYRGLLDCPGVSVVLTGTRTHLRQTSSFFPELSTEP